MKVGSQVKHRFDNPEQHSLRYRYGRVVFWRKGKQMALVKWDHGGCTEHHASALIHVPEK